MPGGGIIEISNQNSNSGIMISLNSCGFHGLHIQFEISGISHNEKNPQKILILSEFFEFGSIIRIRSCSKFGNFSPPVDFYIRKY